MSNEPYTPLMQSRLWEALEAGQEKYPTLFACKIDEFHFLSLETAAAMEWVKGGTIADSSLIIDEIESGTIEFDTPHVPSVDAQAVPPEQNPLYDAIPELSPELITERPLTSVNKDYSPALCMPTDVDLHYLTLNMMMLKMAYQHAVLFDYDHCENRALVREGLNTGFDIIRARGLEENFAKSCAEMAAAIPALTDISPAALEHQQKVEAEEQDFKTFFNGLSSEQRQKAIEMLEQVLKGLDGPTSENIFASPAAKKGPGGPKFGQFWP